MNCQQAQRTIAKQLDGEASLRDLLALRDHLERCRQCSVFANDLGRLTGVLRTSTVESAPASVTFAVQERLSRLAREGDFERGRKSARWAAISVLGQFAATLAGGRLGQSSLTLRRRAAIVGVACSVLIVVGLLMSVRTRSARSQTDAVESAVAASTAQVLTLSAMDPLDDVTVVNNLSRSVRDGHAMVH